MPNITKTVFLLTLTLAIGSVSNSWAKSTRHQVAIGDISESKVSLDAEWNFYWGIFLSELNRESRKIQKSLKVRIPTKWDKLSKQHNFIKKQGFATYELFLDLKKPRGLIYLRVPELGSSWRIFVNGKYIDSSGVVGKSKATSAAGRGATYVPIRSDKKGIAKIWLEVSAFHHNSGGLWTPMSLHKNSFFFDEFIDEINFNGIVIGFIAIMGIYHLILFMIRSKSKAPLYFGLFCIAIVSRRISTADGNLLIRNFPNIDSEWFKKLEFLAIVIGGPLFMSFVKSSYTKYFPRGGKVIWFAGIIGCMIVLIGEQETYGKFLPFFHLIIILSVIYSFTTMFRAAYKKEIGASVAIAGAAIFFFSIIYDILVSMAYIQGSWLLSYGLMLLILFQASNIAMRFSNAFAQVEKDETTIKGLNKELNEHIENLDRKVASQTRHIRSVLDSLRQGIFSISNDNLTIDPEYSSELEVILAGRLSPKVLLRDLLFAHSSLDTNEKNQVEATLQSVVGQDAIVFEANEHLLPKEISIGSGDEAKYLDIDWSYIIDEHDSSIEKIIVAVRDSTEIRRLRAKNEKVTSELKYLHEIIEVKPEKFRDIIQTSRKLTASCRDSIQNEGLDRESRINLIFRNMHTLKGLARTYKFSFLAEKTHHAENRFSQIRDTPSLWDREQMLSEVQAVSEEIDEYQRLKEEALHQSQSDDNSIQVSKLAISEIFQMIDQSSNSVQSEKSQQDLFLVRDKLFQMTKLSLEDILTDIVKSLESIAQNLDKPMPNITYSGDEVSLKMEYATLIQNVFVHLFRNSMDHGIEPPNIRKEKGKDEMGNIEISVTMSNNGIQLTYADDGSGLDLHKLKERTSKMSERRHADLSSPLEIARTIFIPGFSTKSEVSDLSGRGVGLDVVKEFIEVEGGSVDVSLAESSKDSRSYAFSFQIFLPNHIVEFTRLSLAIASDSKAS
ncbi:MAG: Hpt domain-containing protein [Pseudobacteriovorax sp.]|nr:Hpt domain-containing protein [Pseudobacteriovorax sp.]